MLTAHLDGDPPITEEEAKKKFDEAIRSGDPVKYAAQAGAAAACTAVAGPWTGALCALGAGMLWDKLVTPSCGAQGGTVWCLKECTESMFVPESHATRTTCVKSAPIEPVLLSDRRFTTCAAYAVTPRGCCAATYCQLPGMPAPTPLAKPMTPREMIEARRRFVSPTPQKLAAAYPHGSVTALDEERGVWRVAAPATQLGGEPAYKVVDERTTRPAGLPVVSFTDFLRRTGELAWYKDWRVWAVTGTVVAAGGTLLLWKRRKRRKRR